MGMAGQSLFQCVHFPLQRQCLDSTVAGLPWCPPATLCGSARRALPLPLSVPLSRRLAESRLWGAEGRQLHAHLGSELSVVL